MRICHLSDSHLGAGESHPRRDKSGLTLRQVDIINCFIEAVDRIIAIKPDLCIHAGDLFHAVRPSNKIMAIAGEQLHRLTEKHGIPTVLICGNHDAPKLAATGAAIDVFRNLRGLAVVSSAELQTVEVAGVNVCAVPHMHNAESFRNAISHAGERAANGKNILVTHGVAAGMPEFSMADLGELEIPRDLFAPFDYVALGHYHNFSQVAKNAWYAGSTERLSMAERDAKKGFISFTLDPFRLEFHEVGARVMIDLTPVDAANLPVDDLLDILRQRLNEGDSKEKILRLQVLNISDTTMRSFPAGVIAELKQQAFSLDLRFERAHDESSGRKFGRNAIGRLEDEFLSHLETVDLSESERALFVEEGLKYLHEEDSGRSTL